MLQRSLFGSKAIDACGALALLCFSVCSLPQGARAADSRHPSLRDLRPVSVGGRSTSLMPGAYRLLSEKAEKIEDVNQIEGWSYVVSGAVALLVSTPAYYLTEDTFARAIYSLGQTLGVGAIGYGSYQVLMKNDYHVFQQIITSTRDLSPSARDELSYRFLQAHAEKARATRKIRTITHGLTAALNISSGLTSKSRELSTALYFVGGINVLAAVNFALRRSEEEKFLDQFARSEKHTRFELSPILGPVTGIQLRF